MQQYMMDMKEYMDKVHKYNEHLEKYSWYYQPQSKDHLTTHDAKYDPALAPWDQPDPKIHHN